MFTFSTMVERRIRELQPDNTNPTFAHPAGLWMFLAGPLEPGSERFIHARRNRENEPWLEILGPLNHAARGRTPLFVGRQLERFLNEIRSRPVAGTPLARLDSPHFQWRLAGGKLAEVAMLTFEQRTQEAELLLKQLIPVLPAEIRAVFGGSAPAAPVSNAP